MNTSGIDSGTKQQMNNANTPTDEPLTVEKSWEVRRIVREKYWVQHAESREEAKNLAENPYSVEVIRESARRVKPKENQQ